ncbi:E3 ubiquitin-protein ligase COP1-like isoform X1 [Oratosquilla oratoria]|uniref:E3 ubiquitin-protein ligase COP1-like isoform X1 n=1 Tax=Oratosquilla oratoria TaxID=337810 RepID=UPI003F7603CD
MASGESRPEGSSTRGPGRGVKRSQPLVLNGLEGTFENKNTDYLCSVCFDLISEAHMTKCGHTFCYECIKQSIEINKKCPKCNHNIESTDHIFPNLTVNQLIKKKKSESKLYNAFTRRHKGAALSELRNYLTSESSNLGLSDINNIILILQERREQLEALSTRIRYELMKDFLTQLKKQKEEQLEKLNGDIKLIKNDLSMVQNILEQVYSTETPSTSRVPQTSMALLTDMLDGECSSDGSSGIVTKAEVNTEEGFNVPSFSKAAPEPSSRAKRKRMNLHFDDLKECYFSIRNSGLSESGIENPDSCLDKFGHCMSKFTQFSSLRPLATISTVHYASEAHNGHSNIASSIEFDKDSEYFAVAGLTKRIRIFDYSTVVRDTVDLHYPCSDMQSTSKISCVSWSNYYKNMLASSDYDGTVTVWDAMTKEKLNVFQEHEKRCWSVDFNKVDTRVLASGSDDARVKVWSIDSEHSVASIEAKAHVCCVQFSPTNRYHLAFGSADHCVHYYDLRNMREPLWVFRGHRKAVSYVKFISSDEIVSASTDSLLKIWSVNKTHCVRSLQGHTNEKNFVGLATDGEYVACGSENNALYVYYKGLSKKLFSFKFDQRKSTLEQDSKDEDSSDFVSAVCWRKGSNIIAAGNSLGVIKILEMV